MSPDSAGIKGGNSTLSHHHGVIDHVAFPHVIDTILQHPNVWPSFRATCRAYRDKIDPKLYRHLILRLGTGTELDITSAYGRPPSFGRALSRLKTTPLETEVERNARTRANDLMRGVKVIDFCGPLDRDASFYWLGDALRGLDKVRLFMNPSAEYHRSSVAELADAMVADTLIFFAVAPAPGTVPQPYVSGVHVPAGVVRLVSNILIHPDVGPWGVPLGFSYLMDPEHTLREAVFMFHSWPVVPSTPGEGPSKAIVTKGITEDDVLDRWQTLVQEVCYLIESAKRPGVRCILVDFPVADCGGPVMSGGLSWTEHNFVECVQELLSAQWNTARSSPYYSPTEIASLAELITFCTRDEWRQSLPPGEFEQCAMPNGGVCGW